jgi:leucyl-tRNA synthetase
VIQAEKDRGETLLTPIDQWILSRLHLHIKTATQAMDHLQLRQAIQTIIYQMDQDIQWYKKRVHPNSDNHLVVNRLLHEILEVRVLLLSPFTPHLCEEIWRQMGNSGFVSVSMWPQYQESLIDTEILLREDLVKTWQEDIKNIIQAIKISPTKIYLYAAAQWKREIYHKALVLARSKSLSVNQFMKSLMQDPRLQQNAKQVSTFVQNIVSTLQRLPLELLEERLGSPYLDDFQVMNEVKAFYATELNAHIEVYTEDDENIYDPKNRARLAEPYRPAIYIE